MAVRKTLGAALVGVLLALAGCSSSGDDGARGVQGQLVASPSTPAPARVTARRIDALGASTPVASAPVAADGTFRLSLPSREHYELVVEDIAGGVRAIRVFEHASSIAFEAARATLRDARATRDAAFRAADAAIADARAAYDAELHGAETALELARASGSAEAIAEAEARVDAARRDADAAEAEARASVDAAMRDSEAALGEAEAAVDAALSEVDAALSEVLALGDELDEAYGDLDLGAIVEAGGGFVADDDELDELDWDADGTPDFADTDADGDGIPDGV